VQFPGDIRRRWCARCSRRWVAAPRLDSGRENRFNGELDNERRAWTDTTKYVRAGSDNFSIQSCGDG